ncbi:MAG: hypothetical protein AAGL49_05365, partial [Pseudomonadota bacterium]
TEIFTYTISDGNGGFDTADVRVTVLGENDDPVAADRDVALPAHTGDDRYLQVLSEEMPPVFDAARPDIVFYIAGVDVHVDDKLGRLDVTDAGLAERERMVFDVAAARGVPIAGVLGGGYGDDVSVLAARHCLLHTACARSLGLVPQPV